MAKPFILRSKDLAKGAEAHERRDEIISSLSDIEIDQVAGGVKALDIKPEWDPSSGGDHTTSNND